MPLWSFRPDAEVSGSPSDALLRASFGAVGRLQGSLAAASRAARLGAPRRKVIACGALSVPKLARWVRAAPRSCQYYTVPRRHPLQLNTQPRSRADARRGSAWQVAGRIGSGSVRERGRCGRCHALGRSACTPTQNMICVLVNPRFGECRRGLGRQGLSTS